MGFQCGIVGLPNVGKSTLYRALTRERVAAENYPFCTIEPNVGVVPVPDARFDDLVKLIAPKQSIPAMMRFVDIAGLIQGASQGEGLGNQFLGHIREVQAIVHVVRCFEDTNITHVSGTVDPVSDVEIINTELILADLSTIERTLSSMQRLRGGGNKTAKKWEPVLAQAHDHLNQDNALRTLTLTKEAEAMLDTLHLLTRKPVLYVANIDDTQTADHPHCQALAAWAEKEKSHMMILSAAVEAELVAIDDETERLALLATFGLKTPGLHRLIQAGYRLLGLGTFFTAGPKEVRAWTVSRGTRAPQAASVIHTDFEKGFIRAEVISWEDYMQYQGEKAAKEAGVWRLEGKEYIVQDGDVIYFRVAT